MRSPRASSAPTARTSIRLAALTHLKPIYVLTHDSIGLGEDGPTHQPIEQLATLRAIPNMTVIPPSDATEVVEAWRAAITHRNGPVALVLTRQKVAVVDRSKYAPAAGLHQGGYVLAARLLTFYYFAHFLIVLPILGWVEKTKPLPNSISESILAKASH